MKKIEKQINLKVMNLLWCKVNVKNLSVFTNLYQNFEMVKNVTWTAMSVLLKKKKRKYI